MSIRKTTMTAAGAFAAVLLGGTAAMAAPVVNSALVGGVPTSGVTYETFNGLGLGSGGGALASGVTVNFTPNAQAVQGSLEDVYAAPFLSGGNGAVRPGQRPRHDDLCGRRQHGHHLGRADRVRVRRRPGLSRPAVGLGR